METQNDVVTTPVTPTPETPVDISQGVPIGQATFTDPSEASQTPQDGQTPAEGTLVTPSESAAALERLKQQNARNAKLLHSLGIDPLSDIAEQLENGLITPEMVVQHVLSKHSQPPAVAPTAPMAADDPVAQAEAEYNAAKKACDEEGQANGHISFETLQRYNEAVLRLQDAKAQSVTQQLAAKQQMEQANENVERVLSVARSGHYYSLLPDTAKQTSDYVHVAMTGTIADQEARRMGLDPSRLTPKQYEYFAQKASSQLAELAESLIELGRRQARQGITPTYTNHRPVAPAGSGGQPVGLPNPFARVNHTNHMEAARQYVASIQQG